MRICGGVFVAMCRSDPSRSTIALSSSGKVAIRLSPVPVSPSLHRFADDFFDRRQAVLHLPEAACAERDHPLVDGLASQLEAGGADQDQLAELLADLHHLVEADAPLVAGAVARVAA